jgi:hypothetical protein
MKIEIYGISKEIIEIYKDGKPFFDIVFSKELSSIEEAEEIGANVICAISKTEH